MDNVEALGIHGYATFRSLYQLGELLRTMKRGRRERRLEKRRKYHGNWSRHGRRKRRRYA